MKHGEYSMAWLCDVRRWRYIVFFTIMVHAVSPVMAFRCMFDIVRPRRVVQTNISYLAVEDISINDAVRCKRHASNGPIVKDVFQPIRIHAYFSSSAEINIDAVQRTRLRVVISRLVTTAAHIFSGKFLFGFLFFKYDFYTYGSGVGEFFYKGSGKAMPVVGFSALSIIWCLSLLVR